MDEENRIGLERNICRNRNSGLKSQSSGEIVLSVSDEIHSKKKKFVWPNLLVAFDWNEPCSLYKLSMYQERPQ